GSEPSPAAPAGHVRRSSGAARPRKRQNARRMPWEDSGSLNRKGPAMAAPWLLEEPEVPAQTAQGDAVTRVIAFANQKGGVAKTTSTLNLAVAFAEQGHRVHAIDLDPQGNLTMSQGLNPDAIERSMYDVLVHRLPIEQIIHKG